MAVQSVPITTGTASGLVGPAALNANSMVAYYGCTFRETAGAVATIRVRAGSATGTILTAIALVANASFDTDYLPQGLIAYGGIYYEKVAGTVEGSIRVG